MNSSHNCGVLLLAAGSSNRMGKPKQLLAFNNKTFLANAAEAALNLNAGPVMVVLGAHADLLRKELDATKLGIVENREWREGMASSIRCGMETLLQLYPQLDAVIIMVCDQPYLSTMLLAELIQTQHASLKPIVASFYEDTLGPPALFAKTLFPALLKLTGDAGARKIIQQQPELVASVPFPKGDTDIDTEADYNALFTT